MLAWYRDLIGLRRSTSDLNDSEPGHPQVQWDEEERWIAMNRGSITLVCSQGGAVHALLLPKGAKIELSSRADLAMDSGSLQLPPDTALVLRCWGLSEPQDQNLNPGLSSQR